MPSFKISNIMPRNESKLKGFERCNVKGESLHIVRWRSGYARPSSLIHLLQSEQAIRKTVQLEETWSHELKALQKNAAVEDDSTSDTKLQVDEINKKLLEIQVQYTEQEFKLYHAVSILPSKWKAAYRELRLNEKWFMRPEMRQG
ncbi:hypothetical protein N7528_005213 [Penicillium herquei]|nr:hypothetical protein N7528_005213 [Penicillium herquei]